MQWYVNVFILLALVSKTRGDIYECSGITISSLVPGLNDYASYLVYTLVSRSRFGFLISAHARGFNKPLPQTR